MMNAHRFRCFILSVAFLCAFASAPRGEHIPSVSEKPAAKPEPKGVEGPSGANTISTKPSDDHVELLEDQVRTNRISNLRQQASELSKFQIALEAARKLHQSKELSRAESALIQILEGRFPEEVKRPALLELALVMHDQKSYPKAQQLYAEYVRRYDKDARVPEVLLRQAYLYREMGVPELALSKFYAVMSTCLNLKLEEMEYYQKLVLRAKAEIAETYYLQGKFEEAADYFSRLLRVDSEDLDRSDVIYKLLRSEVALKKYNEAVAHARLYLEKYSEYLDAPEARFLLADSLKKLGRNKEAIQEMDLLLQKQHAQSKTDPQQWLYWQQRAGNDIANQLYREGDFISALQVYKALADVNSSPEWQIPVWYQIGLVYENLKQTQKATEFYDQVVAREKESSAQKPSAALKAISEMAAWRKQYITWESKAHLANQGLQPAEPKAGTL